MRMIWSRLLVIVIGICLLTGCGPTVQPVQTNPTAPTTAAPTESVPEETIPPETKPQTLGRVDSYWTGVSWYSQDTGETEPIRPESWSVSLLLRSDGTAQFRDIHEGISLVDDSFLNLSWEQDDGGTITFYDRLQVEPILRGSCEKGVLTLDYYGLILTMEEKPLPQSPGELYTPAELVGTWLMVSGETEGWEWEAMPARLDTMTIRVEYFDGPLALSAQLEQRDHYGYLENAAHSQMLTVLQQPLHPSCENQNWSVRIGGQSPVDENGYPQEPELYATLLDYNTMLVQNYYTLDGYPAVSYQTYWRFPSLESWMSPEAMNLDYTNWSCCEYRNPEGQWGPVPQELENLEVVLDMNGSCHIFNGSDTPLTGTWELYNGGALLLNGEDDFWFGGAVSAYYSENVSNDTPVYEMTLYYAGGLLRLQISSYG